MKKIKASLLAFVFALTSTSYGKGTEVTAKAPPAAPAKSSITDSADKTKSSNEMGQALNMAMGAVEMVAGAVAASECDPPVSVAPCVLAPMLFLMGMQSFAQGGEQGKTAGQAAGTVGQTDTGSGPSGYDPSAVLRGDADSKAANEFIASVSKGKAGFTYDPKTGTVTTADGKTLKGSDMNSPSSMAAAGIPKSAIDTIMGMEKDIQAKAEKKVGKLALGSGSSEESSSGGGGGGSGGSSASANAESPYGARTGGRPAGLGIDRDPAQVAGMQKNYNGEPIGVAGDSIFKMMTRRYKTKEAQSSFLDESDVLMQK